MWEGCSVQSCENNARLTAEESEGEAVAVSRGGSQGEEEVDQH